MSDLCVEGLHNVRDLGGLPRRGGGVTPTGVFARSELLERVTAAGWQSLHDHGVRTVIDLRGADEGEPVAHPDWMTVVKVDVDDAADEAFWAAYAGTGLDATPLYYLPHLTQKPDRTGAALAAVAVAPPGGVLFHCAGGRDRTGMVAMLLLQLAEVQEESVVADYLTTMRNAPALWSAWDLENPEQVLEETCRARGTTTEGAFRDVIRDFDLAAYLTASGLTEAEVERLRTWRGSLSGSR